MWHDSVDAATRHCDIAVLLAGMNSGMEEVAMSAESISQNI
jgi:hypothetical protein